MFIDYLTLMLINMSAGLFILSLFVAKGLNSEDQRRWAPGFGASGIIALITGLHMVFTWPLPGSYNMAFGELSVLFGTVFTAAAVTMALKLSLSTVVIYAFFAGLASLVIGEGIVHFDMTKAPLMSGAGFILTGLGGILAYPALKLKRHRTVRRIGSLVMLIAAIIWALIGYMAYWNHLDTLRTWHPPTMAEVQK